MISFFSFVSFLIFFSFFSFSFSISFFSCPPFFPPFLFSFLPLFFLQQFLCAVFRNTHSVFDNSHQSFSPVSSDVFGGCALISKIFTCFSLLLTLRKRFCYFLHSGIYLWSVRVVCFVPALLHGEHGWGLGVLEDVVFCLCVNGILADLHWYRQSPASALNLHFARKE